MTSASRIWAQSVSNMRQPLPKSATTEETPVYYFFYVLFSSTYPEGRVPMTDLSRFSADKYPGHTRVTRRERPPTGSPSKRSYAKVYQHEFVALIQLPGSATVLLLELIRQSGLQTVSKRGGWVLFSDDNLEAIGLIDRKLRHRASHRLASEGFIEIRTNIGRHKAQYRLNPNWAKPKAEIVDLATRRKARR